MFDYTFYFLEFPNLRQTQKSVRRPILFSIILFLNIAFFWTLLFMIIIFYTIGYNTYIHYIYYFNKIVRVYTYTKIHCLITLFIFLSFQIFARLRSLTIDRFYFRLLFFDYCFFEHCFLLLLLLYYFIPLLYTLHILLY